MATPRKQGAPTHIMRWAPQDWRTSKVRARSFRTNDPMLRLVYLELLNALHEAGGSLPADPELLADELLLPVEEIERCLPLLQAMGAQGRGGVRVEDGQVTNQRVLQGLEEEADYRRQQQELAGRGGESRARRMSQEQRSDQARRAARARWDAERPQASDAAEPAECVADAQRMLADTTHDACPPTPPPPPSPTPEEKDSSAFADRSARAGPEIPWGEIQSAFAAYGRRPRALSDSRRAKIRARMRDLGPEAPVQAVHGYMALHGARERANGWDPLQHLTPETIFARENCTKYVEAYERAVAQGRSPPFRPETAEERLERAIAEDP